MKTLALGTTEHYGVATGNRLQSDGYNNIVMQTLAMASALLPIETSIVL